MPLAWIAEAAGAAALLFGFFLGVLLLRKRLPISPRQLHRQSWFTLAFTAASTSAVVVMFWGSPDMAHKALIGLSVAAFAVVAGSVLYQWFRGQTPREELENFAADSLHCGRCEYNLTGNISGICPECGWVIPNGPLDVDSPGWAMWWRGWRIKHLRRWRATLAMLVSFTLAFAATAVVLVYVAALPWAVLMFAMAANMLVNAVRVWAYGRRCSGETQTASAGELTGRT